MGPVAVFCAVCDVQGRCWGVLTDGSGDLVASCAAASVKVWGSPRQITRLFHPNQRSFYSLYGTMIFH
eukprot:scaffold40743_cov60-Phaeocystis_antarctica.AAC.3